MVGRTGAGKTSFLKLFWRGLDTCGGFIKIDGLDINKLDLKELRTEMDVISQESALFAGSLRENLDPGSDGSNDEILEKVLMELGFTFDAKRLDEEVDADGANYSVGIRQLICFARVLVSKRKLVILDEATANVDLTTEGNVQEMVKSGFPGSTMFIIAHRLQTVRHTDRILTLKNGRMEEFDTPDNLLKNPDGYFRKLWDVMEKSKEKVD